MADHNSPLPKSKPPPLKIGQWPAWLEKEWAVWTFLGLGLALVIATSAYRGRLHKVWPGVVLFGAVAAARIISGFIQRRRDPYYPQPPDSPPTPTTCEHCGYDLRATPLRCPECGRETSFKQWLDARPLEKALYERRLKPRKPAHRQRPPAP